MLKRQNQVTHNLRVFHYIFLRISSRLLFIVISETFAKYMHSKLLKYFCERNLQAQMPTQFPTICNQIS